jgi:thiamine pyrophosphokinase
MLIVQPVVQSLKPVTVIGGGPAPVEDVASAMELAPLAVAADGGADLACAADVDVTAVIGDFDSVSDGALSRIPAHRQHRIADQSTTDFEKVLLHVQAPLLLGVGFMGGRVDHQLAAFHALVSHAHLPCILIGQAEIVLLAPPSLRFSAAKGDVISLFPMDDCTGRSEGLEWQIDGLAFSPGRQIGTSNRATGDVHLETDSPGMLLILLRSFLHEIVRRLMAPDAARWYAHAK